MRLIFGCSTLDGQTSLPNIGVKHNYQEKLSLVIRFLQQLSTKLFLVFSGSPQPDLPAESEKARGSR
jgi:hypothetical protein